MVQIVDISATRKKLGLSQEKLAEALGVSRNTISRWERGEFNPTADKLAALEQLITQLEGPVAPEEVPVLKEEEVPPQIVPTKGERLPVALICAGVVCALLIGLMALVGVYSINHRLEPYNIVPVEDIEGRGFDESIIIESGTRHPIQP